MGYQIPEETYPVKPILCIGHRVASAKYETIINLSFYQDWEMLYWFATNIPEPKTLLTWLNQVSCRQRA